MKPLNICFIFEKYINIPIAKLMKEFHILVAIELFLNLFMNLIFALEPFLFLKRFSTSHFHLVLSFLNLKSSQYNFPALCKENFKMHLSREQTFITFSFCCISCDLPRFLHEETFVEKKKHFRLTIFLLPLLLPLPPPPHVPSGHPAGGLGPGSGQPHIFTLEPKLGRIKRRGRLRRQGARNSWAITQRLSYTIKRPTVLFFLKCDLGYLCLATLHNYDKRQLRKIASGWGVEGWYFALGQLSNTCKHQEQLFI